MSDKFRKYHFNCDCGHKISFGSSQPAEAEEPVICERCYTPHLLLIPERNERYLYTLQDNKLKLRKDILSVFASYKDAMTVRQMFYRMLNFGYEKSEKFYGQVQREMLKMRESGALPYGFVADNTRSYYKPKTYSGLSDMLERSKILYRRSLWDDTPERVEIWLEKEALRGVLWPVTSQFDVPLYVTKGFASVSFIHEAVMEAKQREALTHIYFFTDHDPSGMKVAESIEKRMKKMGADHVVFHRAALTPEQISENNLPTRPTKKSNHSKGFTSDSVELDAMEPQMLKNIVEGCITKHLDDYRYQMLLRTEEAERETLETIINNFE